MEFHGDSEVAYFSSRMFCAKNLGDCFAMPSYVRNFVQRKRLRQISSMADPLRMSLLTVNLPT